MKKKTKKVILFGSGDLAQIAHEYFDNDSDYSVVAYTVDRAYLKEKELNGLPIIPFDEIVEKYPPDGYEVHVCVVYGNLNRDRAAKIQHVKAKGYKLASYVSSHAFVSPSAKLGEHCFVFEGNVIQSYVTIGDNAILWSSNHCGHHSRIGSNVFVSSHVVISGHCIIGDNTFIGVNSTLTNNTEIGRESWIGAGANIRGIIPANSMVRAKVNEAELLNEAALAKALEKARR